MCTLTVATGRVCFPGELADALLLFGWLVMALVRGARYASGSVYIYMFF